MTIFFKSLLLTILGISSCSLNQQLSSLKEGEYAFKSQKIEVVLQIRKDGLYKLRINEWGHSCYSEGSYKRKRETLSLASKDDFKDSVELDIYQIGECNLKDTEVLLVGQDSLKLDNYILIYRKR